MYHIWFFHQYLFCLKSSSVLPCHRQPSPTSLEQFQVSLALPSIYPFSSMDGIYIFIKYLIILKFMRVKKIPKIEYNTFDSSIKILYNKPSYSLIWLHGLGDTSDGFQSFFAHSLSPVYEGARIKLIQAPLRSIAINEGQLCHAWYDIRSLNRFRLPEEKVFDLDQVRESQEILSSHVSEEINHWYKEDPDSPINPYHRVFVGGFSQGGVIALRYALEAKEPPAGAICFSGYFLQTTQLNNLGKVPILLMHGKDDTVINESEAKNSYNPIFIDKHLVQYSSIEGLGHSIDLSQLESSGKWLKEVNRMISTIYNREKNDKVI